jgi:hypothetical protein
MYVWINTLSFTCGPEALLHGGPGVLQPHCPVIQHLALVAHLTHQSTQQKTSAKQKPYVRIMEI